MALVAVTMYSLLIVMVLRGSEILYAWLLQSVIDAHLAFFSGTDVCVTINRFSQDIFSLDSKPPSPCSTPPTTSPGCSRLMVAIL